MSHRLHVRFATSSVLLLMVVALVWLKDELREDRRFLRAYRQLQRQAGPASGGRDASGGTGVAQAWIAPHGARPERCVACHIGAAEPAPAGATVPLAAHSETAHAPADVERFGCVSCHGGLAAATNQIDAHARLAPLLPAEHVEAGCGRCHRGLDVPETPALARGRMLVQRLGCFNCHEGGDPALASDLGPPLDTLSAKVTRDWLRRWLRNPREVNPNATMPNFELQPAEIEALADYLLSLRPSPAVQQLIDQASDEPAGDPDAGAVLFRFSMCICCHTIEGKGKGLAPELGQIGTKASPAWLLAFMKETHRLQPESRMPSYRFSPTDLRDLVAYMTEELRDFDAPETAGGAAAPRASMAAEGHMLFVKYGCATCHGGADADLAKPGPDLTGIADARASALDFGPRTDLPRTLAAWLEAKVIDPRSFGSTCKMPRYELSADDAGAVVTALLAMSRTTMAEAYQLRPSPPSRAVPPPPSGEVGRLFAKYRCLSCHVVGGEGSDLSTVPLTYEGSKATTDWLTAYLQLPTTIFPLLEQRMPVLKMTAEEARRMAVYISDVYVDDAIPGFDPFPSAASEREAAARGEELFVRKGCNACHILGETGGYVGPSLNGSAERFRPAWIAHWLENPQRWQPAARCPNFGLTAAEIQDLTARLSTAGAAAH